MPSSTAKRTLLVATLGGTGQVVPEVLGFTNPQDVPIYRASPRYGELVQRREDTGIGSVGEVWLVTTEGAAARCAWEWVLAWRRVAGLEIPVRRFSVAGMEDIETTEDAAAMADLLHRVVWWATRAVGVERTVVSLAGGRKTMSADLLRAALFFGHGGLLHVLDRLPPGGTENIREPDAFVGPLPAETANWFDPVVVEPHRAASDVLGLEDVAAQLDDAAGRVPGDPEAALDRQRRLLDAVEAAQRKALALATNYALQLGEQDPAVNFRGLYALPARIVRALHDEAIGRDPPRADEDLAWVRQLPKAELHCHLGGVLDAQGIVAVASALEAEVAVARRKNARFDADLRAVEARVASGGLDDLRRLVTDWSKDAGGVGWAKALRRRWPEIPEPLGVCGFATCFRDGAALLDALVFAELATDPAAFHGIGIERYEALGDLQGSGLLQHEATLRATMAYVRRTMEREGIAYLELRCSPENYTRGGLEARRVVEILAEEAERCEPERAIRFLVIASRHGDPDRARRHVNLVRALRSEPDLGRWIVGFDLAGAEHAARAAAFRELFRDLHREVVRITIHAGETQPVESIWEAVYDLSADRVGHGLTLVDDDDLRARFRERKIAIELCPSSNFQIAGTGDPKARFRDHVLGLGERPYPLRRYLDEGLRVTINTDDPGMSRTGLSAEFLKAAAMTPADRPLTRWEVLQLVANGFRAAFCPAEERRERIARAEKRIVEMLLAATS